MKKFLLCITGLIAGLLSCEVALRLFLPQEKRDLGRAFFLQYDSELGWFNKPGSEGIFHPSKEAKPTSVKINSRGYRAKEFSYEKQDGVKRLVAIGDSGTFGFRLEEEERFSDLIAEKLPPCYEMLNMGVVGYGSDQELMLMEREALKYSPDLMLVAFTSGNDVSDNMNSTLSWYSKPFFTLREGELIQGNKVPLPESAPFMEVVEGRGVGRVFMEYSHLYRFFAYRFWLKPYLEGTGETPEMTFEEGWKVTEAVIKRMKSLCRDEECKLLFVIIPDNKWLKASLEMGMVDWKIEGFRKSFNDSLESNNIPYLDLWTPFLLEKKRSGKELYFEGEPNHWDADGNKLAARLISSWLKDLGLLKACQ